MGQENFEVGFKVTYEGVIVVEADSIKAVMKKVKELLKTNCSLEGEDAMEIESYTHIHHVLPQPKDRK